MWLVVKVEAVANIFISKPFFCAGLMGLQWFFMALQIVARASPFGGGTCEAVAFYAPAVLFFSVCTFALAQRPRTTRVGAVPALHNEEAAACGTCHEERLGEPSTPVVLPQEPEENTSVQKKPRDLGIAVPAQRISSHLSRWHSMRPKIIDSEYQMAKLITEFSCHRTAPKWALFSRRARGAQRC